MIAVVESTPTAKKHDQYWGSSSMRIAGDPLVTWMTMKIRLHNCHWVHAFGMWHNRLAGSCGGNCIISCNGRNVRWVFPFSPFLAPKLRFNRKPTILGDIMCRHSHLISVFAHRGALMLAPLIPVPIVPHCVMPLSYKMVSSYSHFTSCWSYSHRDR